MTTTINGLPKSQKPKAIESGAAGAIAGLAVFFWNRWQEATGGLFLLGDLEVASVVLVITAFTGPALRRWQARSEGQTGGAVDLREVLENQKKLAETVTALQAEMSRTVKQGGRKS